MGSLMGFIEVDRSESKLIPPQDRLKNFDEFHIHLSEANQKKQASRCMDCGMPVCQYGQMINRRMVGCPLHNLIPDYQDALYKGLDDLALKILLFSPYSQKVIFSKTPSSESKNAT